MARRVYFDACALNRPFDDQSQARIRIEAEAVEHLLRAVEDGELQWISSDFILFEVRKRPDKERREMLEMLCHEATERVAFSEELGRRARELRAQGLRDMDALHLAAAERERAELLITTDDQFVRAAREIQPPSRVRVENPAIFELEVFR